MAGFRYSALDEKSGALQTGVLNADNRREARRRLRDDLGLLPLEVMELTSDRVNGTGNRFGWRGVGTWQLSLCFRQFASLLEADISIERALDTLVKQTESENLRRALAGARGKVMEGSSLGQAMRNFPNVFPEMFCALVSAGESSGKLDMVLLKLADYLERNRDLKRETSLALLYPAIVCLVAFIIVMGLMIYVMPKIVAVFDRTGQDLPWLTRTLIFISGFMQVNWPWLLTAVLAIYLLARWLAGYEAIRYQSHKFMLSAPLIGPLIRDINSARLSSALAILVGGSVPLLVSLQAGAGVIGALPIQRAFAAVIARVREGASLSLAIEQSESFPPVVTSFIAAGEENGRLGEMLARAADYQVKELEHRISLLTGLLGPLIILVMGIIVLLIALAALTPIFELNQLAR